MPLLLLRHGKRLPSGPADGGRNDIVGGSRGSDAADQGGQGVDGYDGNRVQSVKKLQEAFTLWRSGHRAKAPGSPNLTLYRRHSRLGGRLLAVNVGLH